MLEPSALVAVGAGGALGAVARYAMTDWVRRFAGDAFPWGTLAVNVTGSLLLGFMLVWMQTHLTTNQSRLFAAVGILGSFTTFSTYSYEAVELVRVGAFWRAGGYALGSLVLGLLAVVVGATVAATFVQARG